MLFILEMANNHQGKVAIGKEIIAQFTEVAKNFPQFSFAFKFQYRDLLTLIHPDFQSRLDIPYIKRFKETKISPDDLYELANFAKESGFKTICTPFDEVAVDVVANGNFDYIKIASCSFTDWPLLNKIAEKSLPVIASTGGHTLDQMKKVVMFFEHRQILLSLLHCVGLYPTDNKDLCLNQIDILKKTFPNLEIGFSTHEPPSNFTSVIAAIAKGATIFEKHVDIDHNNAYSITPKDFRIYLSSAQQALEMCQEKSIDVLQKEGDKLRELQRGAYYRLKRDDKKVVRSDVFFAMPTFKGQITANQFSKYAYFERHYISVEVNAPLFDGLLKEYNNEGDILAIRDKIKNILVQNNIVYPRNAKMEISHHYGLENFVKYGMCLITVVNGEYCKKILILLPHQTAPSHYHNQKDETFFILQGEPTITLIQTIYNTQGQYTTPIYDVDKPTLVEKDKVDINGNCSRTNTLVNRKIFKRGDLLHIVPKTAHEIQAGDIPVIIEELSSTHYKNDSIYLDENININPCRKTEIYL